MAQGRRDLVPTAPSSSHEPGLPFLQTPRKSQRSLCSLFTKAKCLRVLFLLNRKQNPRMTLPAGAKGALITRQLTEDFSAILTGSQQASRLLRGLALYPPRGPLIASLLTLNLDRNHTSPNWSIKQAQSRVPVFPG